MIHTVIFDIGNVLVKFGWAEYFASFGYDEQTVKRLGDATVLSPYWKEYDLGNLSEEEVLDRFISYAPDLKDELTRTLSCYRGILTRLDYAIPWIKELRDKGLKVLYLSNFAEKALRECDDAMDFLPYMDGGIFSCRVHMIKPDPGIYKELLSRYRLRPEECVFLDDMPENVKAAETLGIHGICFRSEEQARAELFALLAKD